jgi:hypothetical protein
VNICITIPTLWERTSPSLLGGGEFYRLKTDFYFSTGIGKEDSIIIIVLVIFTIIATNYYYSINVEYTYATYYFKLS